MKQETHRRMVSLFSLSAIPIYRYAIQGRLWSVARLPSPERERIEVLIGFFFLTAGLLASGRSLPNNRNHETEGGDSNVRKLPGDIVFGAQALAAFLE